ncbi:TetR/AcrR family transcriptional regulator [Paenibacillus methanolicus]|uniref:AcrR family transcriptional regulator n=1 Tax=Paenibacillus methanolicus TaxID=582686 RepID=A0A5S5CGW3_9BACL|nr:TetR/AcrR family transcriptional regulator [Paenibacillus methanolicus]TYP79000.1 AcrR family transcriptional regulator [Paenibacillus methanolicus]
MENKTNRVPGRPKHDNEQEPVQDMLIRTASKLFMEKGYDQVSLEQIAKACQVSKPSIYYHFSSKPELFTASVIAIMNHVHAKTSNLLRESDTLETGLLRVAETRLANPHPEFETILNEAANYLSEAQYTEIRQAELRIYQLLAEHFERAMEQRILRDNDALFLAQSFSTLLLLGNRKDTKSRYVSSRDLGKQIVDLFLRGATLEG